LFLFCDFFTNQAAIDAGVERTLQSNMGRWSAHDPYEVIVIFGWLHINAEVSNGLWVDLRRRIEAKAHGNVLVLEIAVDSLGASDDFAGGLVLGKVFAEQASISVGVISSNYD
jgi:hypothetical protein